MAQEQQQQMNTIPHQNGRGYRLSFIINTALGSLLLLLAAAGAIFEGVFPQMRGTLAFGFLWPAIVCLFIASLHYSKYLSVSR
jgi:hypothetical protein